MHLNGAKKRIARFDQLLRGFERELAAATAAPCGKLMQLEKREYVEALQAILAGIRKATFALEGPIKRAQPPDARFGG